MPVYDGFGRRPESINISEPGIKWMLLYNLPTAMEILSGNHISKTMNITIRNAVQNDIECMCQMLAGLFSIETDFKANAHNQTAALNLLLRDCNNKAAFIAECGSVTAGMITGQLVVSTAAGGYSVLLEDLFVLPGYRRKGIASMLINQLSFWAKSKSAIRIHLVADKKNTAVLNLYRNTGFFISSMTGLYKPI